MSELRAKVLGLHAPREGDGIARAAMLMPDGTEVVCGIELVQAGALVAQLGNLIRDAAARERDALRARQS